MHRHAAVLHGIAGHVLEVLVGLAGKIRERHFGDVIADQAQFQIDLTAFAAFTGQDVPLALLAPAITDGTLRGHQFAADVEGDGFPFRVVFLAEVVGQVTGAQETVRLVTGCLGRIGHWLEQHQHRQIGETLGVLGEISARLVEVEFFEDHMVERLGQRRISTLFRVQPQVGELGDFRVVRGDRHSLGALVANFSKEVRIGGTGLRNVGAPGNDVVGVVPVSRFRHVGLLAPYHWRGWRQVAVPVVEAQAGAADQRQVTGTRGVADHRHRRDWRETDHPVRAVGLDGVDVGRGDDFVDFIPARTNETTHAALALVRVGLGLVLDDARPGFHRCHGQARFTPQLEQRLADFRVLEAVGAVDVPAVARTTRATTGFMVGQVVAGTRVVGLLGFPGDQAVLDVDFPRAGAGAVHPVGGTYDLVVLPARTVDVLPVARLFAGLAMTVGKLVLLAIEKPQLIQ
ncbi:hypothetical protein D3C73_742840 [compost metagenome]